MIFDPFWADAYRHHCDLLDASVAYLRKHAANATYTDLRALQNATEALRMAAANPREMSLLRTRLLMESARARGENE